MHTAPDPPLAAGAHEMASAVNPGVGTPIHSARPEVSKEREEEEEEEEVVVVVTEGIQSEDQV